MPELDYITNISGLGIAGLALLTLFFFVRNTSSKLTRMETNDLVHIQETLDRIEKATSETRDMIRSEIGKHESTRAKIVYLYEEALKKK